MPEDIRQEEQELERRLEERVRKKRGSKGAAKRDHEHHFNDPVLISVLNGLQGRSLSLWFLRACLDLVIWRNSRTYPSFATREQRRSCHKGKEDGRMHKIF